MGFFTLPSILRTSLGFQKEMFLCFWTSSKLILSISSWESLYYPPSATDRGIAHYAPKKWDTTFLNRFQRAVCITRERNKQNIISHMRRPYTWITTKPQYVGTEIWRTVDWEMVCVRKGLNQETGKWLRSPIGGSGRASAEEAAISIRSERVSCHKGHSLKQHFFEFTWTKLHHPEQWKHVAPLGKLKVFRLRARGLLWAIESLMIFSWQRE